MDRTERVMAVETLRVAEDRLASARRWAHLNQREVIELRNIGRLVFSVRQQLEVEARGEQ